jgi:hypothetical protein
MGDDRLVRVKVPEDVPLIQDTRLPEDESPAKTVAQAAVDARPRLAEDESITQLRRGR